MSSGSQNIGKWSNPIAGVGPRRPAGYTVPDDWDAETHAEDKDSREVWEEANTKAPMPQIVIAGSTSSAPPPTAFAPSMKILKRPQSASPKPAASSAPQKSLAEREAEYKAARERIFAAKPGTPSPSSSGVGTPSSSGTGTKGVSGAGADKTPNARSRPEKADKQLDTVVRQPRGPSSNSGRGFGNRRTQGVTRGSTPGGSGAQSPSSQAASPRTQTPAPSGHPEKRS
ncbi:hypothetical protein CALCODRAFT_199120 [Calocera cornea HHB12733]|uniref:SUZ RNA-binding domain-containing n=1 Tax=Calocera cornea HHB12733 TaxID=1353952 RepID=A0A165HGD8_9BASI|nr:hypothetical protein CALCODRAFT_199120 [Calocera cornea HHB12733]